MSTQPKKHLEEFHGIFENYKIIEGEKRKDSGVLLKVGGVFQAEDLPNKNGRIYPKETWDAVFSDNEWTECLQRRGVLGELDHPADGGRLRRTSHIVTTLERRNVGNKNLIYGEAEILDVPDGHILETLFRAGARIGISSRGEGTVERDENLSKDIVKEDYRPEAFDFVSKPSTLGAYPAPLSESEARDQNKVVLNALADLVNSTQDKNVLLSCYRTLESFPCSEDCHPIIKLIEEKLVESKNTSVSGTHTEEDNPMTEKVTKEAVEELTLMARDLAAKELTMLKEEHDKEIAKLNAQIASTSARLEQMTKKFDAARSVGESLLNKNEELTETTAKVDPMTEKRLNAARKLLKACLEQIKTLRKDKKRGQVAESLLQAMVNRREADAINGFMSESLTGLTEDQIKKALSFIGPVRSLKEAKVRVEALKGLVKFNESVQKPVAASKSKPASKEPLPGSNNVKPALTEDVRKQLQDKTQGTPSFTSKLWSRIS